MNAQPERIKLSAAGASLLRELVAGSPPAVREAAERIAVGEAVSDDDANAVVDVLSDAMLGDAGFDGEALTARGVQIDDIIGVVQQMSEHFYDSGSSGVT
jgi:hypothetical protein